MYNEYKTVRGSIALPKNALLSIDAHDSHQVCDVFGIHPNLPIIKELYDEKEALFFSGIGEHILSIIAYRTEIVFLILRI